MTGPNSAHDELATHLALALLRSGWVRLDMPSDWPKLVAVLKDALPQTK